MSIHSKEDDAKSWHAYLLLIWAGTELELPQIELPEPGAFPSQPSAGAASQDWALYAWGELSQVQIQAQH